MIDVVDIKSKIIINYDRFININQHHARHKIKQNTSSQNTLIYSFYFCIQFIFTNKNS